MEQTTRQTSLKIRELADFPAQTMDLIEMSRQGLTKNFLLELADFSGISVKLLIELLPVSYRTIQRYGQDERLKSNVSEHLLLIGKVFSKAEKVLGQKKVGDWLTTPVTALGNRKPISLLDTSFGAEWVMDELGRLEQGVYS